MIVVDLRLTGGEHVVPEQDDLFLEGPLGVEQVVKPSRAAHAGGGDWSAETWVVPQKLQSVRPFRLGANQFLYRCLIPLGRSSFQLFPGLTKTGAAHEVGHQYYVLASHYTISLRISL